MKTLDECLATAGGADYQAGAVHEELGERMNRLDPDAWDFSDRRLDRIMTLEEKRFLRASDFILSCSNSGSVYANLEKGLELLPELEAVGLHAIADALRRLHKLGLWDAEEVSEEDEKKIEAIEAQAAGDEACFAILLDYVKRHQDKFLQPELG